MATMNIGQLGRASAVLVAAVTFCAALMLAAYFMVPTRLGSASKPAASEGLASVNTSLAGAPSPDQERLEVVILKSRRRLLVCSSGRVLRSHRIGLGPNPYKDKELEGDGCTPEGEFYICTRNPRSKFTRSLGISYPNREDADRGLKAGLISKQEYLKIVGN